MGRTWTNDQIKAMDTRGKTLLVSAAAGSGKTATLTERIIRRITNKDEHADISDMLIVTFTKAAAAELRVKIFTALSDAVAQSPADKHLASQLTKIGSAKICTIDSFYYDLIQANLSTLGLSSVPRIADDAQYLLLAEEAMNRAIESCYEKISDFPAFIECFSSARQSNYVAEAFLNLHKKLQSLPEGTAFLKERADAAFNEAELDFFATSYGKILQKTASDTFRHYLPIFKEAVDFIEVNDAVNKCYGDQFRIDLALCKDLCDAVDDLNGGYSRVRDILAQYVHPKLKSLRGENASEQSNAYRDIRSEFTGTMDDLRDGPFSKSAETIKRAMYDTAKYTRILYELLCDFEVRVSEEKARMGVITFSDIKRLIFNLLVNPDRTPTDTAKEYAKQFSDIFIDEYQDVDGVQDLIFASIATPYNRFMVGDIKQSIYEFRGADPSLFAKYRGSFPSIDSSAAASSDVACIFMSENFRCDSHIIEFTNLVCGKIFSVAPDSIGYTSKDDLKFSKISDNKERVHQKVKIALVSTPSSAEKKENELLASLSAKDYEAEYIASEIEKLLTDGSTKDNGKRLVPGDIAVLFRTKTIAPAISAALRRRGILTAEPDAVQCFENPDVITVLCILNAIDNPERDIQLAGALRSPIFNFSEEELLLIRIPYSRSLSLYDTLCSYADDFDDALADKCKDFRKTLEAWQFDASGLPIDRFLLLLFESERFTSAGIVAQPNDDGEGGNILMLYEYARSFENGSFKGLYQFIEYINSIIEKNKSLSLGGSSSNPSRVSLMTIHKSKGLEFPVCFVCETTSSIGTKDNKESFVFDKKYGVALKISDETGMARINTPMRNAVLSGISIRQAEEEMRIFYVALTRARERLYVTASISSAPGSLLDKAKSFAKYFDRYTVMESSSSYLDWVLLACPDEENGTYEFDFVNGASLFTDTVQTNTTQSAVEYSEDPALTEMLREKFAFKYKYSPLSSVPSKISVSRLYPDVLDENENEKDLFTEPKEAKIPDIFSGIVSAPSSAERGTATHLFMQFCDFESIRRIGVSEELERLIEKGFIPPSHRELIFIEELESFAKSDLFSRILEAKQVIREQRFNVKLSANGFTKNTELLSLMMGEELAVQGVIDLILINANGEIELYDYKTDRLSHRELYDSTLAGKKMNEKHSLQLSYYAKAAELLFGKPCARIAVYSTHSAKLYDIDSEHPVFDDGADLLTD